MRPRFTLQFQRLFNAVRLLLPASELHSPSEMTRAENLLTAALLALVIMPTYGFFYQALGDQVNASSCFIAMAGALSTIGVLKWAGNAVLAREILIVSMFIPLAILSSRLGGVTAPTVVWFAVCPLVATAGGGLRPGLIWSALSLLAVIGLYIGNILDVLPATVVRDMRLLTFASTGTFVMTVAIFLLLYERINAAAFVRLDQALSIIRDLAIRDELTGVFNRRELIRVAEQERNRVERNGAPFCLCLIDIDHFKEVNDRYGHAAGDQVLVTLAAKIQGDIRKTDCFGRYGGEEFLLLLTGSGVDSAAAFVERIRQGVEELQFPGIPREARVTISIGVAEYEGSETIGQTLSRADEALYRAKHEGRNRVVIAADALTVE
ncbi:GGDEF domain-containing protein [Herbaspirillum sp. ST 5-3]|uniref:GGDEF domain-containing protein n=1 Tax=Oxalobacteraceae TaxID=75682 RepID=UPI0010A2F334|nr:GGDEF domain-containing protein [Herbaspirillum sp. ST 5-3]